MRVDIRKKRGRSVMITIPVYDLLILPGVTFYFKKDAAEKWDMKPEKEGDEVLFLFEKEEKPIRELAAGISIHMASSVRLTSWTATAPCGYVRRSVWLSVILNSRMVLYSPLRYRRRKPTTCRRKRKNSASR